jgi:hypothetical protein
VTIGKVINIKHIIVHPEEGGERREGRRERRRGGR